MQLGIFIFRLKYFLFKSQMSTSSRYFTALYCFKDLESSPAFDSAMATSAAIVAHPSYIRGSWSSDCERPEPVAVGHHKTSDILRELELMKRIADSQLGTIQGLVMGCEKYGLTETTPVLHRLDYLERELAQKERECEQLRAEANIGKIALRFVDRAGNVHHGIEDAATICADVHSALSAVINSHSLLRT